MIKTAKDSGCSYELLESADKINKEQRKIFIEKIKSYFKNDIKNKTFAVWGLAFKPKTNDMREAPSITVINALLESGADVVAYDPKAMEAAFSIFGDKIKYAKNSYQALENADAMLLLTEWNEFRRPDFDKIKHLLKRPVIFDGRNQYDSKRLASRGFEYICVGKRPEPLTN